jgi:hypothetical protein
MAALAALRIDGPPPTPRPYGIVTTPGTIVPEGDGHWRAGVVIDSYPNDLPESHNPCAVGTMRVKAEGTTPPQPEFSSFTVVYPFSCSGIGLGNEAGAERARNRVRQAFIATEGWDVEQELAFGISDETDRPHFTSLGLASYPAGGVNTAVGPREALALLENVIGDTAHDGMIHVDSGTFIAMAAWNLIDTDGTRAYTVRGTTVIIGDGYKPASGQQPGSALTADESYAWATGPVRLTRDEVEILGPTAQVLDTETNRATFRAERNYVAYFDTALVAGVRVDRSATP